MNTYESKKLKLNKNIKNLKNTDLTNSIVDQSNIFKKNNIINSFVQFTSAIFILILIISGNFIAELFPCDLRRELKENIYIKHLFGFLILFFFGVIETVELKNLKGIYIAVILYFIFLITSKVKSNFWIFIIYLYAICYLLLIVKNQIIVKKQEENPEGDVLFFNNKTKFLDNLYNVSNIIQIFSLILIFGLTIVGFLFYMGQEKILLKDKFSFLSFLFGLPKCNDDKKLDKIHFIRAIKAVFNFNNKN